MTEKIPTDPINPNEWTPEDLQIQMADYIARHPSAESSSVEIGPEILKLEAMFASFESTFSLAELHSILELKIEDAPHHPLWWPAKQALAPVVEKLNALQNSERYEELKAKYKNLSRAVGIINNGKVDHTR